MGKAGLFLIGLLSALGAVLWAVIWLIDFSGDARETKLNLAIETARAANLERSQKETNDGIKKLQSVEDTIRKHAQSEDRPAGSVIRGQLERMLDDTSRTDRTAHSAPANP